MRRLTTIVVGFVHDLSAGLWAATVLAVFWLESAQARGAATVEPGEFVSRALQALQMRFFWVGVGCIVLVMATGAGRTFTYVEGVYGKDLEGSRRRILLLKHVVLVAVFGLGTAWQYSLAFR